MFSPIKKKSIMFHIVCTFSHSPIIYGNQVETYGPYPQDYTRDYHHCIYINNEISILSTNNRTIKDYFYKSFAFNRFFLLQRRFFVLLAHERFSLLTITSLNIGFSFSSRHIAFLFHSL